MQSSIFKSENLYPKDIDMNRIFISEELDYNWLTNLNKFSKENANNFIASFIYINSHKSIEIINQKYRKIASL